MIFVHLHFSDCVCRGTGNIVDQDGTFLFLCANKRDIAIDANEWFLFGKPLTADEYLAIKEVHDRDVSLGICEPLASRQTQNQPSSDAEDRAAGVNRPQPFFPPAQMGLPNDTRNIRGFTMNKEGANEPRDETKDPSKDPRVF